MSVFRAFSKMLIDIAVVVPGAVGTRGAICLTAITSHASPPRVLASTLKSHKLQLPRKMVGALARLFFKWTKGDIGRPEPAKRIQSSIGELYIVDGVRLCPATEGTQIPGTYGYT
jgi:hypothetical protein